MAKFELKFLDKSDDSTIEVQKCPSENTIIISLYDDVEKINTSIFLDKSTAIKFAKTLRTEINKITESEVNNE